MWLLLHVHANALVDEYKKELRAENLPFDETLKIGAMIEIPSAVMVADSLARRVQFFSLGTNDLIQYLLAVDRTDDRVSNRYQPLHPAVLKLLRHVRRAATHHGIPVSLCGEMASDPLLLRVLIGCGLTEFSMTPGALPIARRVVQETSAADMTKIAAHVRRLATVDDIERFLQETFAPAAGATR